MDNPTPPKTSEEAIALWRKRRKERQAGGRLSQAPPIVGSAIDNKTTLSGRLVRTGGSGSTVMVALDQPYKGLRQMPATAIDGCTAHGRVSLMKSEDGGWGAIGRGTEQLTQDRDLSRGKGQSGDRYKRIKYLYSVAEADGEEVEPDARRFYVGGHQQEPVEIEDLKGASFANTVPIDNLGGSDFTINATRGEVFEFWRGKSKEWSVDTKTPDKIRAKFVCRGNGFWTLIDRAQSFTTSGPGLFGLTTYYGQSGFIFDGKFKLNPPYVVLTYGSTGTDWVENFTVYYNYSSDFRREAENFYAGPTYLALLKEFNSNSNGFNIPLSSFRVSKASGFNIELAPKVSVNGKSTYGLKIFTEANSTSGTEIGVESTIRNSSEMVWIDGESMSDGYNRIDGDKFRENIKFLDGVVDVADNGFSVIKNLSVTIDDPDSTSNPPRKITIDAIEKAIKFNEPTAKATVVRYSSEFEQLEEFEVDFYLPHVEAGFFIYGYSYNDQD